MNNINDLNIDDIKHLGISEYTNKEYLEIDRQSFKDKINNNLLPEISNETIDQLEWGLMILSAKYANEKYSEAEKLINLKTFDGALLTTSKSFGRNPIFLLDENELMQGLKIIKTVNVKTLSINRMGHLSKIRLLTDNEKFKYKIQNRFITINNEGWFYPEKDKWFLSSLGMEFTRFPEYDNESLITRIRGLYEEFMKKDKGDKNQHALFNNNLKSIYKEYFDLFKNTHPMYIPIDPKYVFHRKQILSSIENDFINYLEDINSIRWGFSIALTSYFEWFVYIRETEDSIGIKIPINPESSGEIFSMRNIPEGSSRRKAICHYVKQHYRKLSNDYSKDKRKVLVHKYLRGETSFNWRGLKVDLIPSRDDIELLKPNKKFKDI